ncbi:MULTISPECIES: pPIWI_RE module domain-containing protein [Streptomyces]|uniref:pPIWI_RE module domain-containing protein n=1 Tax=Streptomyces TaxID=1883 RepID=UPI000B20D2D3|nr:MULTISPECIES: DUF3962 domain-containing protein [Streptomyces]
MPVNYECVRTGVWLPATPGTSMVGRYRALPFPEHWQTVVMDLCNAGRGPGSEPYRTVPTVRFEQVVQALVPDLLVMPRPYPRHRGDKPGYWLYASEDAAEPIPPAVFDTLVNYWLADLRPEPERRAELRAARTRLADCPPRWDTVEHELVDCPVTAGGTAAPLPHQFLLSTDRLARRILDLGPYTHGGGDLRFRVVPRSVFDRGAQLVSQALPYDTGRRTSWYSVVLDITLQTVPFDPLARFHLHWSIRRWATRVNARTGRIHLPHGRKSTVLLRPRVPYLAGAPSSERYAVARVERRWSEGGDWQGAWVNGGPTGILRGITLGEPFPEADEVLSNPEAFLLGEFRAGVVHSTAMGEHDVKAGLMSHQRSQLTEWAEQALPPGMRSAPPLVRTRKAGPKPINATSKAGKQTERAEQERCRAERRRLAVAYAASCLGEPAASDQPPTLEVRLLWQSPALRQAAIGALAGHLGLPEAGGDVTEAGFAAARPGSPVVVEWFTPELTVRLRCLPLIHGMADGLALPERGRRPRDLVTAAVHTRRMQAAAWLREDATRAEPGLALVEIDRAADYPSMDHDPKFALRLGCADAGFVTQFTVVPKKVGHYDSVKNLAHRVLMAWDDGLRQLGVRVHPEHGLGDRLPPSLRYAAVWLVQKNRTSRSRWAAHVPVAVLVTPGGGGSGLARIQGWDPDGDDGAGTWISYPAMLLKLVRQAEVRPTVPAPRSEAEPLGRPARHRDRQQRQTEEWLQGVRDSLRRQDVLLLVHAQNARRHWTWIQDGAVERDRIRDGQAPARRLAAELRLVRVRDRDGRETPQWWGVHPEAGPNGLPAHLWKSESERLSRVFYSTTAKPVQFKSSAVEADKLAPRPLRAGPRRGELTTDVGKPGWSPMLLEIAVLGCDEGCGDDPESLALAVHQLRQAPDYPEALALPLPLHLARLGQEYVLPIRGEEAIGEEGDHSNERGEVLALPVSDEADFGPGRGPVG